MKPMTRKNKVFLGFLLLPVVLLTVVELGGVQWVRATSDYRQDGNFYTEKVAGQQYEATAHSLKFQEVKTRPECRLYSFQPASRQTATGPLRSETVQLPAGALSLDRIDIAIDENKWWPFHKRAEGTFSVDYRGKLPDGTPFWGTLHGDITYTETGVSARRGFRDKIDRMVLETVKERLVKHIESKMKA